MSSINSYVRAYAWSSQEMKERARGEPWEREREKRDAHGNSASSWIHYRAEAPRLFPLPMVPRPLSIFSIIAIFMGIPSGSLCGGESWSIVYITCPPPRIFKERMHQLANCITLASVSDFARCVFGKQFPNFLWSVHCFLDIEPTSPRREFIR